PVSHCHYASPSLHCAPNALRLPRAVPGRCALCHRSLHTASPITRTLFSVAHRVHSTSHRTPIAQRRPSYTHRTAPPISLVTFVPPLSYCVVGQPQEQNLSVHTHHSATAASTVTLSPAPARRHCQ
ncbi:hypothetical protein U1Q18_037650, partial [Sarracenia purpurea var. burkii]